MSNYQIYGGIAEEEFVDVQDQDFVDAHFGVADNTGGHFGTTIGTTDVQYSKNAQGEIVGHNAGEDGAGQPPAESEYYDGNVGIDDAGGEAYLVEEVKQMVLEADEAEQQKEGEDGPEWVKEVGGAGELEGNGQKEKENMPNEQIETPQLLEQPQMELEQQQNEVAPGGIVVEEIARENDAEEDPPTPTALVPPPPTTPKANNSCQLSEIMAVETQYPVPYRSKLTEPFEPGQTLIVKGKTAEDSVRFTINLHHASADFSGNDVPIHISVRFDEGKMVFNTYSKGEWGKEERKSNPYKKGDDIDIRIRAHDSKFTIFADQKEIKEYEHRVPLSSISHFSIDGDVLITHIHWGGKYYPVPYESGITGDGFNPGKTMLIFGTPEKKGKRFHINLLKKNGDIALHFNPRFDEKAIVRNSLIANEWGNEEREGKNPLEKGIGFDLKIINEEYAFQIFINDDRFCSYAHRMEPHDIHGLQIGGDVEITGIQIF